MLQQTQVDRVVPYYKAFIKKFPTVRILAKAKLSEVLKLWSGLGYNRRAKYLRDAAIVVVEKHSGKFPIDYDALRKLPGVGDYTARAVQGICFQ
jgi:A/G-specific adenine glycosylase